MKREALAIYIHIPFCVKKCAYCDFLSFPATELLRDTYMEKLLWELRESARQYKEYEVGTIFMGGGTPSVLPAGKVNALMETVRKYYTCAPQIECTIECNPGTTDIGKFKQYHAGGINRISIGCQSVHERELKLLGRIHDQRMFLECYRMAREAGIENINVDLMSALPGQTISDWEKSLRTVADLGPEHISAYSLLIEEGTAFYEAYHRQVEWRDKGLNPEKIREKLAAQSAHKQGRDELLLLPSEEEERIMYHRTSEILAEYGYHPYELSNYAKEGRECRHNLVYWERGDYAGFGLGAASCVSDIRWKNTEEMKAYLSAAEVEDMRCERQQLDEAQQREEAMFLGLRLWDGIGIRAFAGRYGQEPSYYYQAWICRMKKEGLLEEDAGRIRLSPRGRDLANVVMAGFLS